MRNRVGVELISMSVYSMCMIDASDAGKLWAGLFENLHCKFIQHGSLK